MIEMETQETFLDYYEILGVWPTADDTAIKKAYFKLARMHHPDIAGRGTEGETPEDPSNVDFKLINEAFGILSDPVKRSQFDQRLKAKGGKEADPDRKEADARSAQLAFEQAKTAMKHNRYDKAVVLLKSAIKYDESNAAYHSWYGLSLGVLKTNLHEARDACKKALEMEFYNSDFHANLGFVFLQAGLDSTANESFEEALKWDPEHKIALKYYTGKKNNGSGDSRLSRFFSKFKN